MITFSQLGNQGRLGNQLFQIAATIALAIRNNDEYIFPNWPSEKYFNLHNCFSDKIVSASTYTEPSFIYTPIPYRLNMNLSGYFQSEKYFEDCPDLIRNLLTPVLGFDIKWNYTSIHVRRGDYTKLTREFAQLDMIYYHKAIQLTKTQKYLVFSDDITWCRTQFIGDEFIFSEGKTPVEDLALMLCCEHNIIANSSFSWWGAYLNKNPSKIVIAPSKWFGPALPHDTKDLLPTDWIKI